MNTSELVVEIRPEKNLRESKRRGLRVAGRGSRVAGHRSRVNCRGSWVNCRGSRKLSLIHEDELS